MNNPFGANPIAVLDRNITYYVTAVNAVGCMAMDTINIKVYQGPELYVPNAFTPNGDGLNDVLKVIAIGMKEFHFFRIYNRYGQLIFSTTDPGQGWDGRMSGKLQNMGTYVWMAEAVDYRGNLIQRNGTSTIVQ
ncbi:MAG: gliding motility-associated C-terminal domain-containing protein [Chitinophagaceae bacterium]|nr:gliding motility-associated C-terminal domain-containing protein [Chitinophagaceae bacterium]